MIRVLHSVSNMDRAGIETMLMNYYRHIDREKVQFDFLCNKTKPGAYDEEIASLGGRIFHTPGLNPIKYPQYLKYMKELFNKYPEYKIIEAHNGALGFYALYAAKLNKIPIRILHAHGANLDLEWKLPLKLLCKRLMPLAMNVHHTCGIAAAKYYFGEKIVEDGNFTFVPNAIDIKRFTFDKHIRNKIRQANRLSGKKIVGHIGRFSNEKNHLFLLQVFYELLKIDNSVYLILLGDGRLMETIKNEVRKLGISERVHFAGNVDNAHEWYQAFDCFVLPSKREGLPVVGVEAQAADLPCVFSDSVTREIGLTPKATFVSLSAPKAEWVRAIKTALEIKERKDNTALLTGKGYDIEHEAIKLQHRYIDLAGGVT